MAEPWLELVANALKTRFESITGDGGTTYWYTPDVVIKTHELTRLLLSDESLTVVYALAPFEVEITEQAGQQAIITPVIDFMLARLHTLSDEPFHEETPLRWTIQNRIFTDMLKSILSGPTLGGVVDNVNFRFVQMNAESVYMASWAVVIGQIAPTKMVETPAELL